MRYEDYPYIDTAFGGPANRNNVQCLGSLKVENRPDCYRTFFRYPEEFKRYFDRNIKDGKRSVRGYSGWAYADFFPIDIDCSDDLGKAHDITKTFLARIGHEYEVDITALPIFFSGAKGFHIYLPAKLINITPSPCISQVFKKFAELLLKPWQIEYDSAIYDLVRIFRIENTVNSKTGLYKIRLTADEILTSTIEKITEMAKEPKKNGKRPETINNIRLTALYRNATELITSAPRINGAPINDDNEIIPKNSKLCYHNMLKGVGDGQRDLAAFRLAAHFRKEGFQEDMIEGILMAWNARNTPPKEEREIREKIRSAFSTNAKNDFGCNDSILAAYCDKRCYLQGRGDVLDSSIIKTIEESAMAYEDYVRHLESRLCKIDLPRIGQAMRGVAPGEVLTILARSGVGKTAAIINLMMRIGIANTMPQLFFTMEQPIPQVYERMGQISMGLCGYDVEDIFKRNDADKKEELREKVRFYFKNILMVEKDFLTPEQMSRIILIAEEQKIGKKIGVVTIDYLGRMKGKHRDSYEVLSENIQEVKHMAKELDIAIIIVAQTSRKGGDGTKEINVDDARDSGQIEEASDFLITMWRPDMIKNKELPEDNLCMKLAKNRKGPSPITIDMKFVKRFLRIDDYIHCFWDIPDQIKAPDIQPEPELPTSEQLEMTEPWWNR